MIKSSFLKPWLEGNYQLPNINDLNSCSPELDVVWVAVNHKIPFHKINEQKVSGLEDAWNDNRRYIEDAIELVPQYKDGLSLDNEDRYTILETLGEAPDVSHPIYFVTISDAEKEEVVYVGKSSSNHSRFNGGHSTAIKLLDPIYNAFEKNIYLCQVMLYNKQHHYLPLEFVGDKTFALQLLDDVESMLIKEFKPKFNNKKTKSFSVKNHFMIQIQSDYSGSVIKNDLFI